MKMSMTTRSAREPSAELLTWDTEFWSKRIARGNSSYLDDWARENTIGCMCLLIPATDQADIHRAEANGARVMDIRVKYERETGPAVAVYRKAIERDIEPLAKIARTAFRGLTRFYADPHFDDERCDDLYENWFRENAEDAFVDVLMIGDGDGPAGFVTVKMDTEEAAIVLIAVADRARGRGMGTNLANAAIEHARSSGIPRITVVTQGCNIPAQRAFQHAGFVLESTDVWLHSWYV